MNTFLSLSVGMLVIIAFEAVFGYLRQYLLQ